MVMVIEALPGLNRCLSQMELTQPQLLMVARLIAAFIDHSGRMSTLQAGGAIQSLPCHRAQVGRFLGRKRWRGEALNDRLRQLVLREFPSLGRYFFLIDGTLCSQQGSNTENTFSTGNRQRRPRQGRRYNQRKVKAKSVHSFTMGLLITPSGIRIPFQRAYKTEAYCKTHSTPHRTTADAAAEMIRALPVPEKARVVVLADTAYEARVVRAACTERGFLWIVPCNPSRVLAGETPRPLVRSLLKNLSSVALTPMRFVHAQGEFAVYRRASLSRRGPRNKPRAFFAHEETRKVHSVGEVRVVFSTTQPQLEKPTPDDVKILLTNDTSSPLRDIVEMYSLRWQIELFFKELKSTLGMAQYRFARFACVEAWVELALTTFLYLELHRARQLKRTDLSDKGRQWWQSQRAHGLVQSLRQASEQAELKYISDRLKTPGGVKKLKRVLQASRPSEYRAFL